MLVPNQNSEPAAVQYGALPYRADPDGDIEVSLVTSRETKRWVIPKGWPTTGVAPHECAAREAFAEAGLVGDPDPVPIGAFIYDKRLKCGSVIACHVTVFPFRVARQIDRRPDHDQRRIGWFGAREAATLVRNQTLARIIRRLEQLQLPR